MDRRTFFRLLGVLPLGAAVAGPRMAPSPVLAAPVPPESGWRGTAFLAIDRARYLQDGLSPLEIAARWCAQWGGRPCPDDVWEDHQLLCMNVGLDHPAAPRWPGNGCHRTCVAYLLADHARDAPVWVRDA